MGAAWAMPDEKDKKDFPTGETTSTSSLTLSKPDSSTPTEDVQELLESELLERKIIGVVQQRSYQGPVPPPEMMRDYNDVDPTFADRLLTLAENDFKHQQEMAQLAIKGEIEFDKRNSLYALIVILCLLLFCGFLAYIDQVGWSVTFMFLTLGALVSRVVHGMRQEKPGSPPPDPKIPTLPGSGGGTDD